MSLLVTDKRSASVPARRGRARDGAPLGSAWRLVLFTLGAFDLIDKEAGRCVPIS